MKNGVVRRKILKLLANYLIFFLICAFLVTCTTLLFVKTLSNTIGIELTGENINAAAKLTFANVVFLSVLFTVIDALRRKFTTERITKHIVSAAKKIAKGDFSVRIAPVANFDIDDNFNEIIACFNKMAEELSNVETLRTDFVSNVSHELKKPLAVMQNYATLLQVSNLTEEKRREYAKGISDASRRLSDMTTNILRLNRLENQQIYPNIQSYDLGEQLCECILAYESAWESKGIQIETELAEDVSVNADAELLSLIWNNLLSNAFKFTDGGGCVRITLEADERYATIKVSDTGCGMSAEAGEHIFDKFYQADTSRATQGNGLGLALVKRVVDIVHGEILVESALGEGTAFTVKIGRGV